LIDIYGSDDSVLLFTETTSNLHHSKAIDAIDQLIFSLEDADFKELQPALLVTFGGMIVSKRIKRFLRDYQPKHHWHIDTKKATDTYFCLSEFVQTTPIEFFSNFNPLISSVDSNYQPNWLKIRDHRRQKHAAYFKELQHSDFKAFEQILNAIPSDSDLQISNSSIIRYAQLFKMNTTFRVFCNRGTSGIDGSTSTAIGAAFASNKQTVCITGDLSFFYDSNALWNSYIPATFRIILINNSGGGIFKIIPGPATTNAANYFETPHCLTAVHLAKMHEFEYASAFTTEVVTKELEGFFESSEKPKILEIFTPSAENDIVLKEYFKYIK